MKNAGKIFEEDFKRSFPDYCYLLRLNDPPQAIFSNANIRFSLKNPFDYIVFDSKRRVLYGMELKTTKYKSISFEDIEEFDGQERMIHRHQIIGLNAMSKYDNVVGAFIINFREDDGSQEAFLFDIKDFMRFYNETSKKSLNKKDLLEYGAIEIDGVKKTSHYKWDIDKLLCMKEVKINE